jgi:hypothetical protein
MKDSNDVATFDAQDAVPARSQWQAPAMTRLPLKDAETGTATHADSSGKS